MKKTDPDSSKKTPKRYVLFQDLVDPDVYYSVPEVGYDEIPEMTEEDFKRARPARDVLPEWIGQEATNKLLARSRGMRGPQKSPKKVPISIRLDSDVIDHYRALGTGWQAQMNADLRQNMNALSDTPQSEITPPTKSKKPRPKAKKTKN